MAIFYTDTGSITNLTVTSLTATGSLLGTASFATTAQNVLGSITTASTASFVTASGVFGPYGANSVVSASFAVSASWAPGGGGGTTFSAGNVNNRIITATGTTPELNGEASMSFDGTTFRVTGSMITNDGTYDSINTSTRTLTDSAGTLAVNWDAPNVGVERRLFDDNGTDSVDWAGRRLLDDGANLSIDWGNPASGTYRNLVDSAGKSSADWENRELRDNVETSSIDWINRIMRDANGTVAINWYSPISGNERKMFDAASTQSIAWNNRILYNENGIPVLDWFTANSAWFSGSVVGTASFANRATTASFAVSASWAPGGSGVTINNNTDNYLVTATGTAATLNGEANATFNGSTLAVTGNVTANSFTGSLQGTATTASFVTASNVYGPYGANSVLSASWAPGAGGGTTFAAGNVNNRLITATGTTPELNGESNLTYDGSIFTVSSNTLITGSLTIGSSSLGSGENTLVVGPAPNGGTGEGGQILLQAVGGTYTSASMLDTYQDSFRILRGTNAGSDAYKMQINLHTGRVQIPNYNSPTAFTGSEAANLGVDSSGNIITTPPATSIGDVIAQTQIMYPFSGF